MNIKLNDKVKTEHGIGIVVEIEKFNNSLRYGVELATNPLPFSPAYYWPGKVNVLEPEPKEKRYQDA